MHGLRVGPIDGPWEMSGPEEGDQVDHTVTVCNVDSDQYEVIEIKAGTLRKRKALGRKIAALLNEAEAVAMN